MNQVKSYLHMKRNLFFIFLFCTIYAIGQNKEQTPAKKGLVFDNLVMETPEFYEYISTIESNAAIAEWQNMNKQDKSNPNLLFSTGSYSNNTSYRMESPVINLPGLKDDRERINLYLKEQFELESYYDEGIVYLSDDFGKTWQILSSRSGKSEQRTSVINLTAYAGKAVQLAFELKADEAYSFAGWDIFDASIRHDKLKDTPSFENSFKTTSRALSGNLTSLDAQKFPRFIFANVKVFDGNTAVTNLDESNFFVSETLVDEGITNEVKKDNTFKVYDQTDSVEKPVDIVFLMDNSGSMSNEQNAVYNNVVKFVDSLESKGFAYRLGLCRFGQGANNGNPIYHNNAGWYTDGNTFKKEWKNVNTIDGSREPSWDAMYYSSQKYSFDGAAQKIFIHITDEAVTGNNLQYCNIKDKQLVIDQLKKAGVTLYTLTENGAVFDTDFGDIARATGGRKYNIFDPFNDILKDIEQQIISTYTIRYTPTHPYFDGQQRDVEIKVNYNGNTLSLTGDYTPGSAPIVLRTDSTLKLLEEAQPEIKPVTIEVNVIDDKAPFPTNLKLFYRVASSSNTPKPYKELNMAKKNKSTWSVNIPENDVLAPGIVYYIKATDGQSTTTAPEFINLPGYPWSFAVLPNVPPKVTNKTSVANIEIGDTIDFVAEAFDNTNSLTSVMLYVRESNEINFTGYKMVADAGNNYVINGLTKKTGITEYYFVATDNFGISSFAGSETEPFLIVTDVPWEVTPTTFRNKIILSGFDFSLKPPLWKASITLGNESPVPGDIIGIFYTDTICSAPGNCVYKEICAGYWIWNGPLPLKAEFFAYGDNPATPEKDGFAPGEVFSFKIFSKADKKDYDAELVLKPSSTDFVFKDGGKSSVDTIRAFYPETFFVNKGENLWSSYLIPRNLSFDKIMVNVPHIEQIKDGSGNIWKKGDPANTLKYYAPGYGYEVFMLASAPNNIKINIEGSRVGVYQVVDTLRGNEESTLIGCPYSSPERVDSVFKAYTNNVYSVDKYVNDGKNPVKIESYSPMYNINDWSDKNLNPGEAYYVFALQPEPNFTFPAPSGPYRKSLKASKGNPQYVQSVETYMRVIIPSAESKKLSESGDEIRAYNELGQSIGKTRINSGNGTILIVDGVSMNENAPLDLRVWSSAAKTEKTLDVDWAVGDGVYHNHKTAVTENANVNLTPVNETACIVNTFPNPVKDVLNISLLSKQSQEINIRLIDAQGQMVKNIVSDNLNSGMNRFEINTSDLNSGVYYLSIQHGSNSTVRKIVLE